MIEKYLNFHELSSKAGDIDPQNSMFHYLCDKFELNREQRLWLAFLFGMTYCGPTVFYIYNEFPDFENVDVERLSDWWTSNKKRLVFQKDRLRVKTSDLFVETFVSYKTLVGQRTQEAFFKGLSEAGDNPRVRYRKIFDFLEKNLRNFGRFSLFIYMELLKEIGEIDIWPDRLGVEDAKVVRTGLCYALGLPESFQTKALDKYKKKYLEKRFLDLVEEVKTRDPGAHIWSVETSLCAFKKFVHGKRYVGYYIQRQGLEISKMKQNVPKGVDWRFLLRYRQETFNKNFLGSKPEGHPRQSRL